MANKEKDFRPRLCGFIFTRNTLASVILVGLV